MLNRPINPWWTVFAGTLSTFFTSGIIIVYVFSLLTKTISAETGLSREVLSFSYTCFLVAQGLGTIILGRIINYRGIRLPSVIFVVICGVMISIVPLLPHSSLPFYLTFTIMGFCGAASTALPYSVAIAGWFDKRRGLALGIMVSGGGMGATFLPQIASFLLNNFGWELTLYIIGMFSIIVPLFGFTFLVRTPPGVTRDKSNYTKPQSLTFDWNMYLGKKEFWIMSITVIGMSVATFGVLTNLVSLLTDRNLTIETATLLISLAGFSSWIGRVIVGYTLDKVFGPYVTSLLCGLCFIGVILLLVGDTWIVPLTVASVLVGVTLGSEGDLITFLTSRYFHLSVYSRVLGVMWVMWAWGGGLGVYISGVIYRYTNSYNETLILLSLLLIISGAIILLLGPYTEGVEND